MDQTKYIIGELIRQVISILLFWKSFRNLEDELGFARLAFRAVVVSLLVFIAVTSFHHIFFDKKKEITSKDYLNFLLSAKKFQPPSGGLSDEIARSVFRERLESGQEYEFFLVRNSDNLEFDKFKEAAKFLQEKNESAIKSDFWVSIKNGVGIKAWNDLASESEKLYPFPDEIFDKYANKKDLNLVVFKKSAVDKILDTESGWVKTPKLSKSSSVDHEAPWLRMIKYFSLVITLLFGAFLSHLYFCVLNGVKKKYDPVNLAVFVFVCFFLAIGIGLSSEEFMQYFYSLSAGCGYYFTALYSLPS